MEGQLLRDPKIFPDDQVLSGSLGKAKGTYEEFIKSITKDVFQLSQEWNYYKDGKAWLGKITYKKKTVCWLSIWKGYFKLGFYFTEKTIGGIYHLDIDEKIKKSLKGTKNIGKLIPVVFDVKYKKQIYDILKVIEYKIESK